MRQVRLNLMGAFLVVARSGTALSQVVVGHSAGDAQPPSARALAHAKPIMPLVTPRQVPLASLRPGRMPRGRTPGATAGSKGGPPKASEE